MIVNSSTLSAIFTDFKVLFQEAFKQAKPLKDQFAMTVPSSTKQNLYPWLERMPGMREWLGDRDIADLEANGYTIVNKKYEGTIALERTDIEDDNLGVYTPAISQLGYSAGLHPDRLLASLITNGFTAGIGNCYDGLPFFSATHKFGKNKKVTYANNDTAKLSATSYAAARAAILSVLNTDGNPFNYDPQFILVVGPTNEANALQIVNAEFGVITGNNGPISNIWKGTAKVVILPDLSGTYANYWALFATTPFMRPLIWQQRQAPRLVSATNPDNQEALMRDKYIFATDYRGNAGYGLWQMAYGSIGTV